MSCFFCDLKERNTPAYYDKKKKKWILVRHKNFIHHIDTNRKNNLKENLVELCYRCHARLHGKIYRMLVKGGILKIKATYGYKNLS